MSSRPDVASLKDVAGAAAVSVATVSRYLNGSLILPADTADRIETAIRSLNYRPNPHARRLSLGRADAIGLVVPDIANPFFACLAASAEAAASRIGLGVVLCATLNDPARELDYVDRLSRNHVDGLIFVTNHCDDGSLAERINAVGRVVILDEDVPGSQAPKVFLDNEAGGRLAARHLVEAGHRRVAFVGAGRGMLSTTERLAGFRQTLSEAGPDCRVVVEACDAYTADHGRAAAHNLLRSGSGATAVFASSDEIAIGLLEVLRGNGVRVPEDLSVIGFDDVGPLNLFGPPLTAVRQPVAEFGRRGVELLARINQQEELRIRNRTPAGRAHGAGLGGPAFTETHVKEEGEGISMTRRISRRTMMAAAALLGSAAFFGGAEAQDKPTFALVQINQQALFFNQMNEGAQKAADAAGAELVIFNANDDPAAQNDAIETYIQQKVDGIIVVAIDVNGVMPAVEAAVRGRHPGRCRRRDPAGGPAEGADRRRQRGGRQDDGRVLPQE